MINRRRDLCDRLRFEFVCHRRHLVTSVDNAAEGVAYDVSPVDGAFDGTGLLGRRSPRPGADHWRKTCHGISSQVIL